MVIAQSTGIVWGDLAVLEFIHATTAELSQKKVTWCPAHESSQQRIACKITKISLNWMSQHLSKEPLVTYHTTQALSPTSICVDRDEGKWGCKDHYTVPLCTESPPPTNIRCGGFRNIVGGERGCEHQWEIKKTVDECPWLWNNLWCELEKPHKFLQLMQGTFSLQGPGIQ